MIKIDISWQNYSMAANMEKFATQLERDVMIALKEYASREGKQVQSVVNMALREFLESQGKPKGRKHVIDAYLKSTQQFDDLYKELTEWT